jgi:hypothetical protein
MTGSDTNKESVLVNPAFAVAPDYDPIIARSTKHTYNDHGIEWDNTGRNSFILDLLMKLNTQADINNNSI